MNTCNGCIHWQRHYPNDGGVCWAPPQNPPVVITGIHSNTQDRVGKQGMGDTMAEVTQHLEPMPVTRYDATCPLWRTR